MAAPLTGGNTTSAKIGDVNTVIAAFNAEIAALIQTASALEERINDRLSVLNTELGEQDGRLATLEQAPAPAIPPDLTDRVAALENMIQRVPAEAPQPMEMASPLGRPAGLDPNKIEMVYDKVTLYFHDLEMYATRVGADRWRLVATMNFITVSPAVWTYDEVIQGTPDEVYEHAMRRLAELAELKPQHDAVHERVKAMSEGSE